MEQNYTPKITRFQNSKITSDLCVSFTAIQKSPYCGVNIKPSLRSDLCVSFTAIQKSPYCGVNIKPSLRSDLCVSFTAIQKSPYCDVNTKPSLRSDLSVRFTTYKKPPFLWYQFYGQTKLTVVCLYIALELTFASYLKRPTKLYCRAS